MAWATLNEVKGSAQGLPTRFFPADNWWNLRVDTAPLDAHSADYVDFWRNNALWSMSADFGNNYGQPKVAVSGDYPKVTFSGYLYDSDTDKVPVPIPVEAITEPGWSQDLLGSLSVPVSTGDRHICIVDKDNNILYEVYQPFYNAGATTIPVPFYPAETVGPGEWWCSSMAHWDMNTNDQRPDGMGGSTAAATQILPGMFYYDEVMGPDPISHALVITLRSSASAPPNWVWPARYYAVGGAYSPAPGETGIGHPPLGARLRLKSSYVPTYPDHPEVMKIVNCLKQYGTIFTDNGTSGMMGGDHDTRWGSQGDIGPRLYITAELGFIKATDFEVIELGWNPPSVPVVGPGRPIDITTTTWTGAATDVADSSDTTYIESPATPLPAQTFTCTLQAVTTPSASDTHQVRVRAVTVGTDPLDFVLALENTDDNSVVASRTMLNVPATVADQVFVLDAWEIALIHSYAGLRIRGYAQSASQTYFVWTAVVGATSYVLQVRPSTSPTYDTYNANVGNVLTKGLGLFTGTYYARVVPVGAGSATAEQTVVVA